MDSRLQDGGLSSIGDLARPRPGLTDLLARSHAQLMMMPCQLSHVHAHLQLQMLYRTLLIGLVLASPFLLLVPFGSCRGLIGVAEGHVPQPIIVVGHLRPALTAFSLSELGSTVGPSLIPTYTKLLALRRRGEMECAYYTQRCPHKQQSVARVAVAALLE